MKKIDDKAPWVGLENDLYRWNWLMYSLRHNTRYRDLSVLTFIFFYFFLLAEKEWNIWCYLESIICIFCIWVFIASRKNIKKIKKELDELESESD